MFMIVRADGSIRKMFRGQDAATVIELATELRCEDEEDYSKRLTEARQEQRENRCLQDIHQASHEVSGLGMDTDDADRFSLHHASSC
jgi:hypothetical protein